MNKMYYIFDTGMYHIGIQTAYSIRYFDYSHNDWTSIINRKIHYKDIRYVLNYE